ncbi:LysE family translocator [Limibacter armeniacum]|uniref:LysE family translocator n=1 Tax=Limibacter armeniacum TaxID=466084 RepID=UPI002FE62CC3
MGIDNFATFIVTTVFFILTPGIDTLFVLNKAITQGKASGIYATLGINAGVMVHTLFAVFGLSIIVARSALVFTFVKYVGALYLLYLGVIKLYSYNGSPILDKGRQDNKRGKDNFIAGFVTNVLNPKVALFFLAFFPQFINPSQIKNPTPFIILGITYAIMGTIWFLILTMFAGMFSKKFRENPKAFMWLNKSSGVVFILMALKVAFTKN